MKTNKMTFALAFALVVTLAATGCKHKPPPLTKIPASPTPTVSDQNDINTMPVNPENKFPSSSQIATAPAEMFQDMIADRAALAADTIHFAYDSAVIRDSEQANLQSVVQALTADPSTKLLIEGNCDERGTEEYNRALGERRALAAREALAKLGIDPMRIRTESFGKDKPVDPGHDEAAWQKNRRDDFVLLHPKTGV